MTVSATVIKESESIPITGIGEKFAPLRIVDPAAERAMLCSMQKYGQISPVVVCPIAPGKQELLDGFKRLRAARQLGLCELSARFLDVGLRAAKACMLQLNRVGRAISAMEEALVVHSLKHEDGLSQVEIGILLGRHKSWVCRRILLIERLSDEAQASIRLGLLPASFGAEIAQLQRCNQLLLLESIRKHGLTWRETRGVVAALQNRPKWEHDSILRDPRGLVTAPEQEALVDPHDEKGLSYNAKRIQQRLCTLDMNSLEVTLILSGTELGQFDIHEEGRLRSKCAKVLVSIGKVVKELREAAGGGTELLS
jgi:ParB-like chromosome segregation protein Spo0J